MTPLQTRLKEILARAQAATPGPWEAKHGPDPRVTAGRKRIYYRGNPIAEIGVHLGSCEDANLIAHARTDVESLAKALEVAVFALLSECYCTEFGACEACHTRSEIEKIMCGGGE